MGLFDFLKKKKVEEPVKEIVKVPRAEIIEWIDKKKAEHREREEVFLLPINERIGAFVKELEAEIEILEGIDIEDRKVAERVKAIVRENLKNYIGYLKKMIAGLKIINKREGLVEKVNEAIRDFEMKSNISFQKAAFLVGKDIQGSKKVIGKFLKDLSVILQERKEEFEEFKVIDSTDKDMIKIKGLNEERAVLLAALNEDDGKLEKLGQSLKDKLKEVEDLKGSDKFKAEENKKKVIEGLKKELGRDIIGLQSLIDFKALVRFYHQFEKEMKFVKEYKDNFKLALKSLKFDKLMDLLKEAKLDSPKIFGLIQIIEDKEKKISEASFDDFGIEGLARDEARVKDDVARVNLERVAKDKKIKGIDESLGKIFEKVESELKAISVEIE